VPGVHNARNALAAGGRALAAGADLAAVSAGLTSFARRQGPAAGPPAAAGAVLIDDSYNANPDSVRAAIDVLAATPGRKILVLGDMGEIGGQAGQFHDEIGGYAKSQGVDRLLALGEHSELAARNFGAAASISVARGAAGGAAPQLDGDTVVLVKGSRFMRMERVADAVAAGRRGNGNIDRGERGRHGDDNGGETSQH
jgi:UDP-N-acetylmuramoyl-tripeptide--D-alanyl-D-alanine ligase